MTAMKQWLKNKITKPVQVRYQRLDTGSWLLGLNSLLAFFTLAVAVWSVQKADWVRPEPLLIVTLALGAAGGIAFSCLHFLKKWLIVITILLGIAVTVGQSVLMFTADAHNTAFQLWWQTVNNARPSDAPIYFVMFLFLVTWIIGVMAFYYLWRRGNSWMTIILGLVMLLINVSNLTHDKYYYLPLFFLPAIPLLVSSQLRGQNLRLPSGKERSRRRHFVTFAVLTVVITFAGVGISYAVPEPPLDKISLKIDTSSLHIRDQWFNVFSNISSKWPLLRSRERDSLLFKDSIEVGDRLFFIINSAYANYWTVRRYDTYAVTGWTSVTRTSQVDMAADIPLDVTLPQQEINYTVESRLRTDVILTTGDVTGIDIPYKLQVFAQYLQSPGPAGTVDTAALVAETLVMPYQQYTVTSRVITASPETLKNAGTAYPLWISGHYLQLPDNFPTAVRDLSKQITEKVTTPYEKALAVKKYLSQFVYDQATPPTPANRDGVEHFLFTAKRGYCTHFASAMATMLRAVGVPTRLNTGYLRGEYDRETGTYRVRARNYHAWVEIYFPDIGWVEFESTPASDIPGEEASTEEGKLDDSYAFTEENMLPPWMLELPDLEPVISTPITNVKRFPVIYFWLAGIMSFVIIAVAVTRLILNRWVEKLKQADTAGIYGQMALLAARVDTPPHHWDTPTEFGQRLIRVLPWQDDNINQITASYRKLVFSRQKMLDSQEALRTRKAWVILCPSLIRYMLRLRKYFFLRLLWKPE